MHQLCRHLLPAGRRCNQPAVNNTVYCRHHQVVKITLAKVVPKPDPYKFHHPLPFVFSEDRAALQINYSLVMAALNDKRIDVMTANAFNRLLRSCEINLRRGPLHEPGSPHTGPGSRSGELRPTRRDPNEKWLVDDEEEARPGHNPDAHDAQDAMVQRVILTPDGDELAPPCAVLDEEAGESHGQHCPCRPCSEEFRNAPAEPHHQQCECGLCVLHPERSADPESPARADWGGERDGERPAFSSEERQPGEAEELALSLLKACPEQTEGDQKTREEAERLNQRVAKGAEIFRQLGYPYEPASPHDRQERKVEGICKRLTGNSEPCALPRPIVS